jgi:hypothetical protein
MQVRMPAHRGIRATAHPRRCWIAIVVATLLVAAAGCSPSYDAYSVDDACAQIGAAVANKALECTDDADEASAIYDQYSSRFACSPETTAEQALACDTLIHNAPCGGRDGFDPGDLDTLLASCDALALDLRSDRGCGAIAHRLDLVASSVDGCLTPPPGFATIGDWFLATFACSPTDTPETVRACRDAMGCSTGPIALTRQIVDAPQCAGVVDFAKPPDVCGLVRDSFAEQLTQCGMGAYVPDVSSWFDATFTCDATATVQRADVCFSISCPWLPGGSSSGHEAPNAQDAILKLEDDMYSLGCAAALDQHDCGWRHAVELWIFGCTGHEAFAHDTAVALEQTFPCTLQTDAVAATAPACLDKLACLTSSDPASAWADAIRNAPTNAGCTAGVEKTP